MIPATQLNTFTFLNREQHERILLRWELNQNKIFDFDLGIINRLTLRKTELYTQYGLKTIPYSSL